MIHRAYRLDVGGHSVPTAIPLPEEVLYLIHICTAGTLVSRLEIEMDGVALTVFQIIQNGVVAELIPAAHKPVSYTHLYGI